MSLLISRTVVALLLVVSLSDSVRASAKPVVTAIYM
jgi:hypothetical protein